MIRDKRGRFVGGYPVNGRDPVSGRFVSLCESVECQVDRVLFNHGYFL